VAAEQATYRLTSQGNSRRSLYLGIDLFDGSLTQAAIEKFIERIAHHLNEAEKGD